MNKAITQGLVLMPPAFSAGLNLWSSVDGRPGDANYASQPNAAYVPADQDFAGCLELQKTTSTQKLRCFQQIPFQPGLYLRVTVRIKAMSGALPSVRIAGWAGSSSGSNVIAADQQGPSVALTSYGVATTITAIVGAGNRQGVDMAWGSAPVYGHFGLDLTGPTGGVVRIDDFTIEDVTDVFHSEMFDWVDVRDFGAIGDGVTDDHLAFEAADTAAGGKTVVVSPGTYFIGTHMTFDNPVKFEGTVVMPSDQRLACTRNYNLNTYAAAFGSEIEGFRKALQVLFYFTDHNTLDLNGRRIEMTEPINVAALAGITTFATRRVLTNGNLVAVAGSGWNLSTATATGTYSPNTPFQLTNVSNIGTIPVGARVTGTGVGREVYVQAKNVSNNSLTLSQPLWGGAGTRSYSFERYKYMLDFSGFATLTRFNIIDMEFTCDGLASGINLAMTGSVFVINDCMFGQPKDRSITSTGGGCQDLHIDRCQFFGSQQGLNSQDRTDVVFNSNSNDIKVRNNRSSRIGHFGVVAGSGGMFVGNHFFGGDDTAVGTRKAGLVLTLPNSKTFITGNYVDNCFIELSNEHDPAPDFSSEYTFGGLSITGNTFTAQDVGPWFSWIVVTPRGPGHSIQGLYVTGNVFLARSGNIDRVERVDTSYSDLNYSSFRNLGFEQNTFNGVALRAVSPLFIEHTQNTASNAWTVNSGGYLPFAGRARNITSLVFEGAVTDINGTPQYFTPYVLVEQGSGAQAVVLRWPSAMQGKALVTVRVDNPA